MATLNGIDEMLQKLVPEDVLKAYSGKTGCACGCGGRYSYVDPVAGTKDRGYEVEPDEVSKVRVTNVLRTIQAHADEVVLYQWGTDSCWAYETPTRAYRVYVLR